MGSTAGARELDLVLFGATGFTGRLVAEYLVEKHPAIRWALAGRDRQKLERVRDDLTVLDPRASALPIVVGDSHDAAAMSDVAKRARVVCTTVGPYGRYGAPLLAACAEHGTHYCDLAGETPWIRAMIDEHHERAAASGARIVPCCGFDSIPSDLGVLVLHDHLAKSGDRLAEAHLLVVKMSGGASGGTLASMFDLAGNIGDPAVQKALEDPYVLNPADGPRGPDRRDQLGPRFDRETGRWTAPFVMAAINTRVVRRSNALLDFAYGRDFRYDEAMSTGRGPVGAALAAGVSAGIGAFFAAAALPPTRKLLQKVLPAPGEGPSEEARRKGSFRLEIHAKSAGGRRLRGVVAGQGDPGYLATSRMLGESALCLAQEQGDALPARAGLLTPASAMGMTLVSRLEKVGVSFAVEDL